MTLPFPQYVQLYPTDRCNQACSFCFNRGLRPESDLTFDEACRLLDIMTGHCIYDLDIMGGEPFLLGWMPDLIRRAIDSGVLVNISTNGSMRGIYAELAGISPESLNIGISLEGSTAERHNRLTGSTNFDNALTGIEQLISLGLDPIVKTVLSRKTMDDIPDIITLLRRLGVRRYYLIHMDSLSFDVSHNADSLGFTEFLSIFEDLKKKEKSEMSINRVNASCFARDLLPEGARCAGGVRKMSVMPDGSVYPCNLLRHMPEYMLGNIFRDGLSMIWKNPSLGLFRSFEENRCGKRSCSNHASCTGGCPAHALFHGYDTAGRDIRCR